MDTDSPRIPCGRSEGSSMGVVDVAFHPPCGLLNTYTVPESIPAPVPWALSLPDSPMAILLPSTFTDTDVPN